jgi:hypothetical protein
MNDTSGIIFLVFLGSIINLIIFYYLIESATKSVKIEKHLSIQTKILAAIANKLGVSDDELTIALKISKENGSLRQKFEEIENDIIGKSLKYLILNLGNYSDSSQLEAGEVSYTWANGNYSVTILFDNKNKVIKKLKEIIKP